LLKNNGLPRILLLSFLLAFSSCLLPPPTTVAGSTNQRPFVLVEQSQPAQASVDLNLNCVSCTFSLQEDDPDAEDRIYTKWLVSFSGRTDNLCGDHHEIPPPAAHNALRNADQCTFSLPETFPSAAEDGTTHTIEVVITDRPFTDQGAVNRFGIASDAQYTVFRWTVNLVRRGTRCDDTLNICTDQP
jgi:hypothetical protein